MKFWLIFLGGVVVGALMGGFFTSFFLYDDVTGENTGYGSRRLVQQVKPRGPAQTAENKSVRSGREEKPMRRVEVPSVDDDLPPSALPAEKVNLEDLPPVGVPAETVPVARWNEASIGN